MRFAFFFLLSHLHLFRAVKMFSITFGYLSSTFQISADARLLVFTLSSFIFYFP